MDEKSAVEQVLAAYEKLIGADKRIKALEKKLADGTITLREGAELNDLRARAFGKAFSDKVLDIAQGEREGTCTALLREGCNDVDELAQAAQRAVLARQGLNLTPPTAPFEEERARKIGHSLEDTTVPDETIQRRAKSATENVLKSQYDRNMKKGAETCASAGLKTYIIRDSGAGCCKWCDEVSGKFAYGSEPKDVYRRHDNCTCTVVYESGRGRQNVWSKQYWSQEQEREYLRLRDEMKPKAITGSTGIKKPFRLNSKEAQALKNQVEMLTFGEQSGILELYPDTLAGVKRSAPMTFEEADTGKVNPKYSQDNKKYNENCPACTMAFEARQRGYDVMAAPFTRKKALLELMFDPSIAWVDPSTGRTAGFVKNFSVKNAESCYAFIDDIIKQGERYVLDHRNEVKGINHHILNIDRNEKGELRLKDNQSNEEWIGEIAIKEYLSGIAYKGVNEQTLIPDPPRLLRIDDKCINPKYAKATLIKRK